MPKRVPGEELAAIVEAVARLPDGGSVDAIGREIGLGVARRTLQRRLAALVAEGRLARDGRGQATRYRVPSGVAAPSLRSAEDRGLSSAQRGSPVQAQAEPASFSMTTGLPAGGYHIPISLEGASISESVRAPIQARPPVGYRRAFLDSYRPGVTWYLPPTLRERLHTLGDSPDRERPAGTYARKLHERLLIDLSWNSSRLEGNTYSLLDTERLIERGEWAEGHDARETQMILNHKAAIDLLVTRAEHVGFNPHTFRNLHALLAENLLADSRA